MGGMTGSWSQRGGLMKLTIFGLPLVLGVIGVSSTQAGLFDIDFAAKLGIRQDLQSDGCGPKATDVGDCEPGKRRREVVKQPCVSPLHHYQRTMAPPLPPPRRDRAEQRRGRAPRGEQAGGPEADALEPRRRLVGAQQPQPLRRRLARPACRLRPARLRGRP